MRDANLSDSNQKRFFRKGFFFLLATFFALIGGDSALAQQMSFATGSDMRSIGRHQNPVASEGARRFRQNFREQHEFTARGSYLDFDDATYDPVTFAIVNRRSYGRVRYYCNNPSGGCRVTRSFVSGVAIPDEPERVTTGPIIRDYIPVFTTDPTRPTTTPERDVSVPGGGVLNEGDTVNIQFPEATGGDGPLSASLIPSTLPGGLTFDSANRRITGTVTQTEVFPPTEFTYTVNDDGDGADGAGATIRFPLTARVSMAIGLFPDLSVSVENDQSDNERAQGSDSVSVVTISNRGTEASPRTTLRVQVAADEAFTRNVETSQTHSVRSISGRTSSATDSVSLTLPNNRNSRLARPGRIWIRFCADTVTGAMSGRMDPVTENNCTAPMNFFILNDEVTFDGVVSHQQWVTGRPIAEQEDSNLGTAGLPGVYSENPVTYTLTPDPPEGVTFDPVTRIFSGTPTRAMATTQYTLAATTDTTNRQGETVAGVSYLRFNITVSRAFDRTIVKEQEWIAGTPIAELVNSDLGTRGLPAAATGNPPITYTLTPDPPAGVTFDPVTRIFSGTPTGGMARTRYTLKATDSNGDAAFLRFYIRVESVDLRVALQLNQGARTATARVSNWGTKTYYGGTTVRLYRSADSTVSPATDMELDTGRVAFVLISRPWVHEFTNMGTPLGVGMFYACVDSTRSGADPETGRMITVPIGDTDTTNNCSEVVIAEDGVTVSVSELAVNEGDSETYTVVLNSEPSGNVTITPSSSNPDVTVSPSTLTFTASDWNIPQTVTVTGEQDDDSAHDTATVSHTVTGYGGVTTEPEVSVTVGDDEATFGFTQSDSPRYNWHRTVPVDFQLPQAVGGGSPPISYGVNPDLPAGLTLAPSTARITGTPTGLVGVQTYTLTATDSAGLTGAFTFRAAVLREFASIDLINLNQDMQVDPREEFQLNYRLENSGVIAATANVSAYRDRSSGDHIGTITTEDSQQGETVQVNVPASSAGGVATGSFDITARARAGQVLYGFCASWHELDRGAEMVFPAESCSSSPVTITIRDTQPVFSASPLPDQIWIRDESFTLQLPEATGGNGGPAHTTSDLPAGLSFDDDTLQITGSPTTQSAQTVYTLTASDRDEPTPDTATFTFRAQVEDESMPTFTDSVTRRSWVQNRQVELTLPAAGGGNGDVTYTLSPALPADLTFNPQTRRITGTPTGTSALMTYTLTATDSDTYNPDTATLTFEAEVLSMATDRVRVSLQTLTVEEGGTGTYTVVLDTQPAGTVTVTPQSGDTDAATVSPALEFTTGNWETPQTVTVTGQQDADSSNNTVTVSHTVTGYRSVTTADSVTVTVTDDDVLDFSIDTFQIERDVRRYTQGARNVRFQVRFAYEGNGRSRPNLFLYRSTSEDLSPRQFVGSVGGGEVTGTGTSQLQNLNASFPVAGTFYYFVCVQPRATNMDGSMAAPDPDRTNDCSSAIRIEVVPDLMPSFANASAVDEQTWVRGTVVPPLQLPSAQGGDTPLTYGLSPALPAGLALGADRRITGRPTAGSPRTVYTLTATDSDAENPDTATFTFAARVTGVTVSTQTLTVAEGGNGTYTVVLEAEPSGMARIMATTDNPDVTVNPSTLTFMESNWNTAQTVTVSGAEDDDDRADDTATVSHAVSGYGTITTADDVSVTVTDNDAQGVTVTPQTLPVAEGGTGTYTVVLDAEPRGEVMITPSISGDTDVTVSTSPLTFTASNWNEAQTVTVSAAEDDDGANDSATVSHSVSGYGSITSADAVSVTVTDNDTDGVTVSESSLTITEGGTETYTVVLDTRPGGDVRITPSSNNPDVRVSTSPLTFTTGNWDDPQTVTVSAAQDDDGADDSATVSHTVEGYGASASDVSVTVTDDDAGVTVSQSSLTITEGGTGTYTVVLDTRPGGDVRIAPSSNNPDVRVSSESLTFTTGNWDDPQTVTVSAAQDADGADDSATVSHSVSGYGGSVTVDMVSVTVTDDDAGVTVSESDLTITEGGTGTYTVVLNAQPGGTVTITPSSDNGEVTANPLSLTFTTGDWNTAQTVTLSAAQDADGANDSATVNHTVEGYGASASDVSVTVTDDDAGVTVSESDLTITEGGTGTYTVVLNAQPGGTVTIDPSISGDTDVTVSPSSLTFTTGDWDTSQTVTVSAAEDNDGANDSATVSHSVSGYGSITSASDVSVTVMDDDELELLISDPSGQVTQGGPPATYTVRLSIIPSEPVTVTPSGDGLDFNPSELTFTESDWNTDQTVTVSVAAGADVSGGVTVSHAVTDGTGAAYRDYVQTAEANRIMVRVAGVMVSQSNLTITEGGTGTYTVVLETLPGGTVTITPSSDNPDVTVSPSELTFTTGDWNTAQTVTLSAAQDDDGADGTATVSHTVTGYGSVTVSSVAVTVTDDDELELLISDPSVQVTQGGPPATYTVSLSIIPSGPVTVTPSGDGLDFNPSELTFTESNWDTPQMVTVSVAEGADVSGGVMVSHEVTDDTGADYPGYVQNAEANRIMVMVMDDRAKLVMKRSLAVLGRTVATSAVETISERFSASGSAPGSRMRGALNGRRMTLSDFRKAAGAVSDEMSAPVGRTSLSVESAVSETDAEVTIAGGGENEDALTLWIKGDFRKSEGEWDNENLSVDGETYSSYLGLDYRFGEKALLGFALSASKSELKHSGESSGKLDVTLASVYPYVHWKPHAGLELWALAGAGKGEGELRRDEQDTIEDIGIGTRMFAGGARQGLLSWHWFDFALKTDAYAIWVDSDSDLESGLESADASVQRVRLALDVRSKDLLGSVNHNFASGVEVGGRMDSGDGGSGLGADVGVSLGYAYIPGNVSVDARGRFLVFHEESGFKDWGAGLTARVGSGANERGLSLSVSSDWGGQSSGGVAKLWESGESLSSGEAELDMVPSNVTGELGYGLSLRGSDMFVPFAKLGLDSSRERSVGMGARWELAGGMLEGLGLELLGEQKENENGFADYRIGITGAIRF